MAVRGEANPTLAHLLRPKAAARAAPFYFGGLFGLSGLFGLFGLFGLLGPFG